MSEQFSFPPHPPRPVPDELSDHDVRLTEISRETPDLAPLPESTLTAAESTDTLPPEETGATRSNTALREIAETLLMALLIFLTVRTVVQNFKVEGSSMEPTLHHGQYLLVNKANYWGLDLQGISRVAPFFSGKDDLGFTPFGTPNRGDIVVFRYPKDPSRDFIKRVVALPGEAIEIRAGIVYVNDRRLDEPYIVENPTYSWERTVLPEGHFFVLGDNRNNSHDSHVWGPVPLSNIVGRAWLTYWPWKDWGFVPDYSVAAGVP